MSANAPRSIDEYLKQLRAALAGQDAALVQDALYDAEEYLRAEVKGKAALKTPAPASASPHAGGLRRFFGVFMDVRAYTSLFYMLLSLATGILYFTFVVTGL